MRITTNPFDYQLNWIERVIATFLGFWEYSAVLVGIVFALISAAFIVLVILQILFWIFL